MRTERQHAVARRHAASPAHARTEAHLPPAVPHADPLHPDESSVGAATLDEVAELFRALATPSRLRILLALERGEATVTELTEETGLSQPLVSQHLKLLRTMRLVDVRRDGRTATYSVHDHHVTHVVLDALEHVRERG